MTDILAISAHPSFGESINFLISGFTIVLLTLFVLSIVTSLVGRLFSLIPKTPKPVHQTAPVAPPSSSLDESQVIAAITAAVHTVIKEPVRLRKVTAIKSDESWSHDGRRRIQESHNIR